MRETRVGLSADRNVYVFPIREPEKSGPDMKRTQHDDIYLTDHVDVFRLTARIMNDCGLTDIILTEHEDQTRNGQPLDKEKVRLIIQDSKQSGHLDRFFTIAFDAVLVRSTMKEQKISEEEQVERLQKLIDERTGSLGLSIGNDNRGKKPRAQTVFWKKRKNYVSK